MTKCMTHTMYVLYTSKHIFFLSHTHWCHQESNMAQLWNYMKTLDYDVTGG